jgi:hypothetical protein
MFAITSFYASDSTCKPRCHPVQPNTDVYPDQGKSHPRQTSFSSYRWGLSELGIVILSSIYFQKAIIATKSVNLPVEKRHIAGFERRRASKRFFNDQH